MKRQKGKMILIDIPYAPVNLFIYISDADGFNNKVRRQYPEWEGDKDADGMHFQNQIYVEKPTRELLLHETAHFLDWLFEYMQIQTEHEFKACLLEYVISKVCDIGARP